MLIRIMNLLIAGLIVFIILKASSFGWKFSFIRAGDFNPQENASAERLRKHVYRLSYEIGDRNYIAYDKLKKAADYIDAEFKSYGYDVSSQEYTAEGKRVRNIIATKNGASSPKEVVIAGAHYDTCFNPGADDNASGIAGILELSRLMVSHPTRRSIKFIAFVNEEPPFFQTEKMGSMVYARTAKSIKEEIKGAVILETIGYYSDKKYSQRYPPILGFFFPNKGNFIAVAGNFKSRGLVKKVVLGFKAGTKFPVESISLGISPTISFSDHWSFWQEGYQAAMITDTAFYRNKNYHLSSDTYEKLDYNRMAEMLKGLNSSLVELAN